MITDKLRCPMIKKNNIKRFYTSINYFYNQQQNGFTLVELLVSLAVLGIFIVAMGSVFTITKQAVTTQGVSADVQQKVRMGLQTMMQDIRLAGLDPDQSDLFGVEQATSTKIRFTKDIDQNGVIDDGNEERITYELQGTQVVQIQDEGTASQVSAVLLDNVANLNFSFFDSDNSSIAPPVAAANLENIHAVDILLSVNQAAGRDAPVQRQLDTRVICRNMRY